MDEIILKIRRELKKNASPENKKSSQRFFKEEIKTYGVKTPLVRQIAKRYFRKIKSPEKKKVFKLSEEFLRSGHNEEAVIAIQWLGEFQKDFEKSDFFIFEKWLEKYIDNWGKVDDFCAHSFGYLVYQFPELLLKTRLWVNSPNRWVRRASAVVLVFSLRKGKYLKNAFGIADSLIEDKEDLVQKGYGWMLKEASNLYPQKVFNYVLKNKKKMSRTALRYAVEKLPKGMREESMAKN